MHINSLPTDILFAILKPYCEEEFYFSGYIIRHANILFVCQKWRRIALPVTFNKLSISLSNKLWTSIDVSANYVKQYLHTVHIKIDSVGDGPLECLEKILETLEAYNGFFGNVENLILNFEFPGMLFDHVEQGPVTKSRVAQIAKKFKVLLPGITSLRSNNNSDSNAVFMFEAAFIKLYAPQLTQVKASSKSLDSDTHFANSLFNLGINWYWDSQVLSKINVDNLTKLELVHIDRSFDWSVFYHEDADNSGIIYFPVLKSLIIDVIHNQEDLVGPGNKFIYTLETPQLEYLDVNNLCPFTCYLLTSMSTEKMLNKFIITNSSDFMFTLYRFGLSNSTKNVFNKYYNSSLTSREVDFIKLANDLQATKGFTCSAMEVIIDKQISTSDVQRIYWPHVTKMTAYDKIGLADVLKLIKLKLPKLVWLEAYSILIEDTDGTSFVIPELQDGSISPIKSKLRSLDYGFGNHNYIFMYEACKVFEKSMAKVIKSLKSFRSSQFNIT